MAVNYNPRVVTDGLIAYFDASNPRSYISGNITSIVDSYEINVSSSLVDGFLVSNGVQSSAISIPNFSTPNNLTFVLSVKRNENSYGTLVSLYGDNSYAFYTNSNITTSNNIIVTLNAVSTLLLGNAVSNSAITQSNNIVVSTNATGTITLGNVVSASVNIQSNNVLISTNATGTRALANAVSNSATTESNNIIVLTNATTQDIYFDYPDKVISVVLDKNTVLSNFKDGPYEITASSTDVSSNNDIITVVFKKNSQDSSIKIYLNRSLEYQSSNSVNLSTFGTNFSLLNRNGEGCPTNSPVRSVLVYNKELSSQEVFQVSSAITKRI